MELSQKCLNRLTLRPGIGLSKSPSLHLLCTTLNRRHAADLNGQVIALPANGIRAVAVNEAGAAALLRKGNTLAVSVQDSGVVGK